MDVCCGWVPVLVPVPLRSSCLPRCGAGVVGFLCLRCLEFAVFASFFPSVLVRVLLSLFALRPLFSCSSRWSVPSWVDGVVPSRWASVFADLRGCWVWGRMCLWGGSVPVSEVSVREAWSLVVSGR
jgi:hypothetical protein